MQKYQEAQRRFVSHYLRLVETSTWKDDDVQQIFHALALLAEQPKGTLIHGKTYAEYQALFVLENDKAAPL
jgi:hypothetical protein